MRYQKLIAAGHGNVSNVFKLKSLVATGTSYDAHNCGVNQVVRYYQAVGDGRYGKLKGRSVGSIDQQIKDIPKDICSKLEGPQDELFFYGFGRGAYIVRAVASIVHYMGLPKSVESFYDVYQKALDVQNAHSRDDSLNGNKLLAQLRVLCNKAPTVRFIASSIPSSLLLRSIGTTSPSWGQSGLSVTL